MAEYVYTKYMAKAKKSKSKKTVKAVKKKTSGLMKFLEATVLLGTAAAVLIKFFRGKKR